MAKTARKFLAIALFATLASAALVSANSYAEAVEISDFSQLMDVIASGGEAKLVADITATAHMDFTKEFKLDLNGHKINAAWKKLEINNKVTIDDTSEAKTGEISPVYFVNILDTNTFILDGGKIANDYSTVQFGNDTIGGGGTFIMNGGELFYDDCGGAAVAMNTNSTFTMNGGTITQGCADAPKVISAVDLKAGSIFTMNGGTINAAKSSAVTVWADAELVVNDGTITAKENAITSNGTNDPSSTKYGNNAKITVNGGTITSDETAIYAPAVDGVTIINGGTLTGKTGIEIRAGSLTVNGGTITGTADIFSTTPNGSGTTTLGAAIAIAQHTTQMPIDVNITGGTLTALSPLALVNPQGNDETALAKISVGATGGEFVSTASEPVADAIALEKFISGGVYSNEVPEEYIVDGYVSVERDDGKYIVVQIHNIIVADDSKDAVTVEAEKAPYTKKVKVTAKDKDGYTKEIIIKDASGAAVTLSGDTFEMPDSDVTISVKYTEIPVEPDDPVTPDEPETPTEPEEVKTDDVENPKTNDDVLEFAIIFEICAIGLTVASGSALYCKKHCL